MTTRISGVNPTTVTGRVKALLDATSAQLGRVPNLYASLAQSPAALDGYLAFRGALSKGVLDVSLRERIALVTAAINGCGYCVSAHTFRGAKIGIPPSELDAAQRSDAQEPKVAAALRFVDALLQGRGRIDDADLSAMRAQGWSDEEVGEIIGHVALNVFSNYFNHVAAPELDFPNAAMTR